jgi:putative ATP-binding cassette transporter
MASTEPEATPTDHEEAHARLLPQLGTILRSLFSTTAGRTVVTLAIGLFLIIVGTAYGQVRLNRWNQPFYDAISRRDFYSFLYQLGVFCLIAGSLLILNVTQAWVQETLKLKLREGLVRDLLHRWMQPGRALMLAHSGSMGVNPDQRMHEDASRLCELSTDLGSGLLQSSILLITFIGVLWVLSRRFVFHWGEREYALPGYMVWAAIVYALFGSFLSYRVGRTLIPRNAERYGREADLRFSLVRVNEHLDGISLAHGEEGELRRVELHLNGVLLAMRRLVTGLTNLTWVTAGFGWITIVAPIIVASPLYFEGTLSFGGMMQAAAAFSQAQSSLSWFVNNFRTIADWRAILLRVANFRRALLTADAVAPEESRIEYAEGPAGSIVLENLQVSAGKEHDQLAEPRVELHAGERLLIIAEPGTGKTRLFRALAGLWPWGSGRVTRPAGEQIVYLPRGTPYLPRGTLREVLAYPAGTESFDVAAYAVALRRVGLDRLVPLLDETHRWDRELSQEEQFGLAFARIVLHRPRWLIVDDTLGSLDDETLQRVIDIFSHELQGTGVIHIGSAAARDPLFSRVAHLVRPPRAGRFPRSIALVLLIVLCWPMLSRAAAPEQTFGFTAPTLLNDAHTSMLMRDLAVRVLPVYSDRDHLRYLTNLSALQMVAGDYTAAYATRQDLRAQLHGATGASPEQSVIYDIFAHTEDLVQRTRLPFGQAFARSFNDVMPKLNDLTDYTVSSWFGTPLSVYQSELQDQLQAVRNRRTITLPEALQLVWAYLAYEVHLSTGPQADELIAADQQTRYVIDDDVLIHLPNGVRIAGMLVRPRGARPLPTLLEFTIYPYPDNFARECAAHGYVGVVAYSRGKRTDFRRVQPYVHDGDDARGVIAWIAHQSWSDGRVGMYGSGYSAFAAWAAAQRPERALKAIATASPTVPGITMPDRGNVFLNSSYRWARLIGLTAGLDEEAYDDEAHWSWLNQTWYRSGRPYNQLSQIDGRPNPMFSEWLRHPSYDRYWQRMIPYQRQFAHIDIPILAITGYYDRDEPGALYYFQQHYRYDSHANHTLVIGPYDEFIGQGPPPAVLRNYSLDPVAQMDWHSLRYQWFDSIFKGATAPALLRGHVIYELMGANRWASAPSVAAMGNASMRFYLWPGGSDLGGDGWHSLTPDTPRTRVPLPQAVNFADRSDADWVTPVLLQSANLPVHYGNVFVSAPLRAPVQLSGLPSGELEFRTNKLDFDFTVALYERLSDGTFVKLFDPPDEYRASYVADRSHRHLLAAGPLQRLHFVSEHLVGRVLPAGARLVLVLSIAKRPDQEINYGSDAAVSEESIASARTPLRIRWLSSSHIDLPIAVVPAAPPARAQPPLRPAPQNRAPAAPPATPARPKAVPAPTPATPPRAPRPPAAAPATRKPG